VYELDAKGLLIQGHFLKEKFSHQTSPKPVIQPKDSQP